MKPTTTTTDGWFRVWILWSHCSEILVDVQATCADSAIQTAVWRGLVSGLGFNPHYHGIHAVPLAEGPAVAVECEVPAVIIDLFPASIFAANGRT